MDVPASDPIKILIVDDSPADRLIYRKYLLRNGEADYEFAEADDGRTGLAVIPAYNPDCILLDFKLPDLDGLQFLAALSSSRGKLPCAVVMLTAMGDENIAVEAMKLGATDYVPKKAEAGVVLGRVVPAAIERFETLRQLDEQRLELAASKRKYETLLHAIPQLVWVAGESGRIEYANRRWTEYTGVQTGQPLETAWQTVLHGDDLVRSERIWREAQRRKEEFEMEQRLRCASDGSYRWHLVRAVPMSSGSDVEPRWFGTCTDIQANKDAEAALVHNQKWESLGLLAGGMAHDFNNLLTVINAGAMYAASNLPAGHQLTPTLNDIAAAGEHAAQLTGQMLAYAGKGHVRVENVDIAAVVQETCHLAGAAIPKNVSVNVELAGSRLLVRADAGQIQQVTMNLVVNASEAIRAGDSGLVHVRAYHLPFEPGQGTTPFGWTPESGDCVVIEVKDSGCGITQQSLPKIFDPFFSTKGDGRGLGLAAVQGIVRRMGGAIDVHSQPGSGTTFRVFLSAAVESAVAKEQPQRAAKPEDSGQSAKCRGTVLIIDDEGAVRRLEQICLENAGYEVLTAESGEAGIAAVSARSDISLVLLDSGMPGMNGKQVLEHLRASDFFAPVVVCSGYSEDESIERFADLDVAGFVKKPFRPQELVNAVDAALVNRTWTNS